MMFDPNEVASTTADRLAALRAMAPADRARVLAAQPEVAAALVGRGILLPALQAAPKNGQFESKHLALLLAHPTSIRIAIGGASSDAYRLLSLAVWRRGALTEADMAVEAPELDAPSIAARRAELVDRMLVDPARGWCVPRPGVADVIGTPGRSITELADGTEVTTDALLATLRALGVSHPPTRKAERVELLAQVLRDSTFVASLVASLDGPARALLDRMTPDPAPLQRYEVDAYLLDRLRYQALYPRYAAVSERMSPVTNAMHRLRELGIVGVDADRRGCWVWLEPWTALHGRLFAMWDPPTDPRYLGLARDVPELPPVIGRLQTLLAQVQAEPMAGLKVGGVGVKVLRDLAKRLGQPARSTALLVPLARRLQLIDERGDVVGKGRNASFQYTYVASASVADWGKRPAIDRWALVVDGWLRGLDLADQTDISSSVARRQLVADLLDLPDGTGVHADDAPEWFVSRHMLAQTCDVEQLIEDARLLGLAPATGPLGLTDLARALLRAPADAARLLPAAAAHFVVQPDHSVVAPPNLDADVRARLERIATLTGDGGALVFRLDAARIGQEVAAGETADSICRFLEEFSSVAVAPAVTQFVVDAERRRGGLTVAGAATVITADDALGLADALKVKAAQLRLLAPTVAVSDLPPAKVLAALRAKGLAPRADGSLAPAIQTSAFPSRSQLAALHPFDVNNGVRTRGLRAVADPPRTPDVLHPGAEHLLRRIKTT